MIIKYFYVLDGRVPYLVKYPSGHSTIHFLLYNEKLSIQLIQSLDESHSLHGFLQGMQNKSSLLYLVPKHVLASIQVEEAVS